MTATFACLRLIPRSPGKDRQRFDIAGATILFAGLLSLMLALTTAQARGFFDDVVVALFALGAIATTVFIWFERVVEEPMIDLTIFRKSLFTIGLVSGFATFVAIAGTILLMPFYLENILGYAPLEVGILMAIVPVVLVITSPVSGALSDRFGTRPITIAGLAVILLGYMLVGTLDKDTTAIGYVLRFLPVGLGMGMFQSPNNSAIMGAVPRDQVGVASGLLSMTRTFGATTGVALLGTLWAVRVSARAFEPVGAEATRAPLSAQLAGLHDMLLVVQVMIFLALALTVWDQVRRRR